MNIRSDFGLEISTFADSWVVGVQEMGVGIVERPETTTQAQRRQRKSRETEPLTSDNETAAPSSLDCPIETRKQRCAWQRHAAQEGMACGTGRTCFHEAAIRLFLK